MAVCSWYSNSTIFSSEFSSTSPDKSFPRLQIQTKRSIDFKHSYALKYGLMVSSRTASGKVNAAKCGFCLAFGREKRTTSHTTRKTVRARKYNLVFSMRFRTDMFTNHHISMHYEKWQGYTTFSDTEKLKFSKWISCLRKRSPRTSEGMTFLHSRSLQRWWTTSSCDTSFRMGTSDGFRNSVIRLLNRENDETYLITINNSMKFDMVV